MTWLDSYRLDLCCYRWNGVEIPLELCAEQRIRMESPRKAGLSSLLERRCQTFWGYTREDTHTQKRITAHGLNRNTPGSAVSPIGIEFWVCCSWIRNSDHCDCDCMGAEISNRLHNNNFAMYDLLLKLACTHISCSMKTRWVDLICDRLFFSILDWKTPYEDQPMFQLQSVGNSTCYNLRLISTRGRLNDRLIFNQNEFHSASADPVTLQFYFQSK